MVSSIYDCYFCIIIILRPYLGRTITPINTLPGVRPRYVYVTYDACTHYIYIHIDMIVHTYTNDYIHNSYIFYIYTSYY